MLNIKSLSEITCYGSNVFAKIIDQNGDTCSGVIIEIGSSSTIRLEKGYIIYFNINDINSKISTEDEIYASIAHYKIFGYKRPIPQSQFKPFIGINNTDNETNFKKFGGAF